MAELGKQGSISIELKTVSGLRVDHDDGTQTWSQFKFSRCAVRTASATSSGGCTILHVLEFVRVCVYFYLYLIWYVSFNNYYHDNNVNTHNNNVMGII